MNMPFRLKRRQAGVAAVALLFKSDDLGGLLRQCAALGLDPLGRVYPLAGALLLRLESPSTRPVSGTLRLRALARNLFLPIDADFVPALLDDEAEGMARDRGLVFLPWGGVLGFDPTTPLELTSLLVAHARPRRDWRPLPTPPPLANRIEEIVVERRDESPEPSLDSGRAIGTEEPRPEDSGLGTKLAGGAALGAGRGMVWLGRALGLKGMAALGADWVASAMQLAPRLSEAVLGRQAAALQALLKEFREGDLERALRRALPLGAPGEARGGVAETGDQLPTQDLAYSLDALLAHSGRKPASLWLGGQDVMAELAREYRKAAERAIRDGDPRRAAMIYGKLLRDERMAAQTLLRGGLHHDAAVVFLDRLGDLGAAARAFEAAGDFDRAVPLYRRLGEHDAAGDLLRRIGEDDAALAEYRLAAERLASSRAGSLAAARLMLNRAGRPDLALDYFRGGWARRPEPNALACALGALRLHANAGEWPALRALLGEADAYLTPPGPRVEAALFYNSVARLANDAAPAETRDELRDRALLGLAATLRQEVRPGTPPGRLASELLGQVGIWPAALVRDADLAVKAAARAQPPTPPRGGHPAKRLKIGVGVVTAVCATPDGDEIFLGFEGGDVVCLRPETAEIVRVAADDRPVASLAASPGGRSIAVLRGSAHTRLGALNSYVRIHDGSYRPAPGMTLDGLNDPWLTPILQTEDDTLVGLWDGHELSFLSVTSLLARGRSLSLARPDAAPPAALLLPSRQEPEPGFEVLIHDGREWCLIDPLQGVRLTSGLLWRPCLPAANLLRSVPLSWTPSIDGFLEVAGLGGFGTLQWAAFQLGEGSLELVATNSAAQEGGYLAATSVRPSLVAAVTPSRIEWFRCGAEKFAFSFSTEIAIPSAVACFTSRKTAELIVVCDDGTVVRVSIPLAR